ncbi:MAG: lytic transglycosylase domain-containing protein [Acidobacteria bacterium]|nr:lytic transglycosylase domain-containing protein [Acidobacteriota bacterium]
MESQPGVPAPPVDLGDLVSGSATRYGFDPAFVQSVVAAESAFDQRAVSKAGARGLMQLMPDTARRFGIKDVHDPATNLEAGVAFLRELVSRFDGDVTLALAAYNAGPESVARYGGVPPYEETRAYLARIRSYYGDDLQRADRAAGASTIRLAKVEAGGVPCYTNLRPRRSLRVIPAESRGGRP